MGLFDEVVGAFLKGDAGKYQAILSWVEEQGGIQVLLEKLQSVLPRLFTGKAGTHSGNGGVAMDDVVFLRRNKTANLTDSLHVAPFQG